MPADPSTSVTPRELELIALYASGHQFDEIGKAKFISALTVRNNLYRARDRVGAKNLTHLCILCLDAGVIRKNGVGYKPVQEERVVAE